MLIDGTLEEYGREGPGIRTYQMTHRYCMLQCTHAEKFEHPTKLSVHYSFFDLANLACVKMLFYPVVSPIRGLYMNATK